MHDENTETHCNLPEITTLSDTQKREVEEALQRYFADQHRALSVFMDTLSKHIIITPESVEQLIELPQSESALAMLLGQPDLAKAIREKPKDAAILGAALLNHGLKRHADSPAPIATAVTLDDVCAAASQVLRKLKSAQVTPAPPMQGALPVQDALPVQAELSVQGESENSRLLYYSFPFPDDTPPHRSK